MRPHPIDSGGAADAPSSERRLKPPTTRTIARAAGVSGTTVSMALRNHPAIAEATRKRIQRIASEMGYVPDPELSKLMHHLQQRKKSKYRATVAALTTFQPGEETAYALSLRDGAERCARELGYSVELHRIAPGSGAADPALQRVLWSRGVEGVLLLPMRDALSLETFLDWSQFSVVAATCGILVPRFHCVAPDQFCNGLLICRSLAHAGHRRIGLVLDARVDLIDGHRFSAAVAWQNTLGGTKPVAPFVYRGRYNGRLRDWFARERPDAIIAGSESEARNVANALSLPVASGPVVFTVEERAPGDTLAGIDQHPAEVGTAAVKALHLLFQRCERGIPPLPNLTMVPGRWIEPGTTSAPAKRPRRLGRSLSRADEESRPGARVTPMPG